MLSRVSSLCLASLNTSEDSDSGKVTAFATSKNFHSTNCESKLAPLIAWLTNGLGLCAENMRTNNAKFYEKRLTKIIFHFIRICSSSFSQVRYVAFWHLLNAEFSFSDGKFRNYFEKSNFNSIWEFEWNTQRNLINETSDWTANDCALHTMRGTLKRIQGNAFIIMILFFAITQRVHAPLNGWVIFVRPAKRSNE